MTEVKKPIQFKHPDKVKALIEGVGLEDVDSIIEDNDTTYIVVYNYDYTESYQVLDSKELTDKESKLADDDFDRTMDEAKEIGTDDICLADFVNEDNLYNKLSETTILDYEYETDINGKHYYILTDAGKY
jgi:hypothetical protein